MHHIYSRLGGQPERPYDQGMAYSEDVYVDHFIRYAWTLTGCENMVEASDSALCHLDPEEIDPYNPKSPIHSELPAIKNA